MSDPKDPNISRTFQRDVTGPEQTMGLDGLYKTAEKTNEIMTGLLITIGDKFSVRAYMGPIKKQETAQDKCLRKFGGEEKFLTDVVRGKIEVNSAEDLACIKEIFENKNSVMLENRGITLADKTDNFSNPKMYTWYRGLQYKAAVQTEDGPHIVELQVVSPAMEAVYDITHKHKRIAEEIYNDAAKKDRDLTDEEMIAVEQHYAVCQYYNSKAAYKEGYDTFLQNTEQYAFTPERQESLIELMAQIDVPHTLDDDDISAAEVTSPDITDKPEI